MNRERASDVVGLLHRARQGDAEASSQLLAGCRNYLKLLARLQIDRVIQAKVDPSDLVQEVCMHAHQGFAQFRGSTEAELLGWLRQILAAKGANLARRFRGTKRRNVHLEQRLLEAGERSSAMIARSLVAADSAPSQRAMRRERAVALADALSRLPDHYREVVILHSLEELPLAQVAEKMGRSAESVRKLWARALIQLRHLLENEP